MLLDSNIIIYSALPENEFLLELIAAKPPAVSGISFVEVLGYHRLGEADRKFFEDFFAEIRILPLSQPVLDEAVRLRQDRVGGFADRGYCSSLRPDPGHPQRRRLPGYRRSESSEPFRGSSLSDLIQALPYSSPICG